MYQVGIVGCGVIGERLASTFAEHEATTVTVACDRDETRVSEFAADHDCEAVTDHETLVTHEAVDVVYVGVPPAHHVAVATDALAAGRHVLCEKPIAPTADGGEELVAAAASATVADGVADGRTDGAVEADEAGSASGGDGAAAATGADRRPVTGVNLPFRYTPGFRELRERVREGAVGDVRRVDLHFRFPRWPREWQDVSWLEGREQGGPIREVGTHFLFGVEEVFGPIRRLTAEAQYAGPDRYEQSVVGSFVVDDLDGDGEVHGSLDLATDVAASEENSITVLGTDGSLSLTEWYKLIADRGEDDEQVLVDSRASSTLALVDAFVAELDGEGGDLVSFEEATRVQRAVDAVFDSAGEPVSLAADAE